MNRTAICISLSFVSISEIHLFIALDFTFCLLGEIGCVLLVRSCFSVRTVMLTQMYWTDTWACVRTVICKTIQHSVLIYWAVLVGRSRCLLAEILIVTVWHYPYSFVPFNCRVLMSCCVQTASLVIWLKRWKCKGTLVLQRACHTVVVSFQRLKPALLYLIIWELESSRNEFNFCVLLWVTWWWWWWRWRQIQWGLSVSSLVLFGRICFLEPSWQLPCLSDGWLFGNICMRYRCVQSHVQLVPSSEKKRKGSWTGSNMWQNLIDYPFLNSAELGSVWSQR